jgi:uncharacterized cofD-like protein
MNGIDPSLKYIILNYLCQFQKKIGESMNLQNGSLGNFVLLGAYFAHNNDMNAAIYVFRQLCSIHGNVWPVSLLTDVHVGAYLEDGKCICGQERVTNLDRHQHRAKIWNIFFSKKADIDRAPNTPIKIDVNPIVIEALKTANIIVFGPGSFYTSILPHLMIEGIVDAIASQNVPKILIGNMRECNETYNRNLGELVDEFLSVANKNANAVRAPHKYLTHILVNDSNRLNSNPRKDWKYLPVGNIERSVEKKISLIIDDFEDPWRRGYHKPDHVANIIANLASA